MKQYIKTLALCLMVGLSLASCNENFDGDEGFVTYPQHVALGTWKCEHVNSTTPYSDFTISLALNEQGDTICNLTFYWGGDNPYGWIVFANGEVEYDPSVGMTHVYFDATSQGIPADLYMTYQRNLSTMGVQFTMQGNSTLSFRATPVTSFDVVGQWTGTDAAGNTLGLNFDNEEGTCNVTLDYADATLTDVNATGTYTFIEGTGTVAYTTTDGQAASIALGLNDRNQLTATTASGTTYVMAR